MAERDINLANQPVPGDVPVDTVEEDTQYEGHAGQLKEPILQQAIIRCKDASQWWDTNFQRAEEDVTFAYGDQWDSEVEAERGNRPMLTFNILPQYINNVIGAARKSKFGIQVAQVGGLEDDIPLSGGRAQKLTAAEIMEGLIRDIEQRSDASRAYCRAFQHALEGGFGWLRVMTRRPPEDPFTMELEIAHVKDRWSVLMDPKALKDNFSDAQWGAITSMISRAEFEARYGDLVERNGIGTDQWLGFWSQQHQGYWGNFEQGVRVAEYWWKEPEKRTAVELVNPNGDRIVMYDDELEDMKAKGHNPTDFGYEEKRRQEVDSYRVKYMRFVASEILDGPHDWPSWYIPLVPVLGREVNEREYNHYTSLIRFAHDPQRMYNYWLTAVVEKIGMSPNAQWIGTPEQFSGYEDEWDAQAVKHNPVLHYRHMPDQDKPERIAPANMPVAEMGVVQQSRVAIMDTLGMHEASIGQRSNETSGTAIERRQAESDNTTYEFMDNLAHAIMQVGRILTDMIPRMYNEDAIYGITLPEGTRSQVRLNEVIQDPDSEMPFLMSIQFARYNTVVEVGPSLNTQRREFVQVLQELGRSNPEIFQGFYDLIWLGMDVPFSRELARRARMMIPRKFLPPELQQGMPPEEPSPEEQAEMAKAQAQMAQAEAAGIKAQADVQIAELELEKAKYDAQRANMGLQKSIEDGIKEDGDGGEGDSVSKEEVQNIVSREVAKALAAQSKQR